MKKWYEEEYEFCIEVTGFLHGDKTERYCQNGEEIGDKYTCTYGCPVNKDGYGICSKTMMMLYLMIPNIVFAIKCKGGFDNKWNNKYVEIIEQVGRFGCFGFMNWLFV